MPEQLSGYRVRDYNDLVTRLGNNRRTRGISFRQLARIAPGVAGQYCEYEKGAVVASARKVFEWADALGFDLALVPREEP